MAVAWETTSSSVVCPSCRPSVNAKPELVVATALKPKAANTRADPASHALGITNGSPACSAAKASPFAARLRIGDPQHDLAGLPAGHAPLERLAPLGEREHRVDGRTEIT